MDQNTWQSVGIYL